MRRRFLLFAVFAFVIVPIYSEALSPSAREIIEMDCALGEECPLPTNPTNGQQVGEFLILAPIVLFNTYDIFCGPNPYAPEPDCDGAIGFLLWGIKIVIAIALLSFVWLFFELAKQKSITQHKILGGLWMLLLILLFMRGFPVVALVALFALVISTSIVLWRERRTHKA